MTLLRALRLLVFGETWTLPLGVAFLLLTAEMLRHAAPAFWDDAGGFVLLAGVIAVLVASVARTRGIRRTAQARDPGARG